MKKIGNEPSTKAGLPRRDCCKDLANMNKISCFLKLTNMKVHISGTALSSISLSCPLYIKWKSSHTAATTTPRTPVSPYGIVATE